MQQAVIGEVWRRFQPVTLHQSESGEVAEEVQSLAASGPPAVAQGAPDPNEVQPPGHEDGYFALGARGIIVLLRCLLEGQVSVSGSEVEAVFFAVAEPTRPEVVGMRGEPERVRSLPPIQLDLQQASTRRQQ